MLRKIEKTQPHGSGSTPESAVEQNPLERLLTPPEAADFLSLGISWLAKSRMRGGGPPYVKVGRSIRYAESALVQWIKANTRNSTSERD